MNINTVIFDLGGVLIDWNPRHLYRKIFNTEEEVEFFIHNICTGAWNAEQDRGRLFSEAIALKQAEYPDFRNEIAAYNDRWTEMISGPIQSTVEILNKLYYSGNYRLYALTNWSAETFPYAEDNFTFLKMFEGILVSGREKLIKPDPEIYNLMCKRFGIYPSHSIFIDDSYANVSTADKLGFNTVHYQSVDRLRHELHTLGIII